MEKRSEQNFEDEFVSCDNQVHYVRKTLPHKQHQVAIHSESRQCPLMSMHQDADSVRARILTQDLIIGDNA
eukprot:9528620-Ditylum_brightwellii.AAC.1